MANITHLDLRRGIWPWSFYSRLKDGVPDILPTLSGSVSKWCHMMVSLHGQLRHHELYHGPWPWRSNSRSNVGDGPEFLSAPVSKWSHMIATLEFDLQGQGSRYRSQWWRLAMEASYHMTSSWDGSWQSRDDIRYPVIWPWIGTPRERKLERHRKGQGDGG